MKGKVSRKDAKSAKNEKQLDFVILGALGVFARVFLSLCKRQ
jgi:hypothetical protein